MFQEQIISENGTEVIRIINSSEIPYNALEGIYNRRFKRNYRKEHPILSAIADTIIGIRNTYK